MFTKNNYSFDKLDILTPKNKYHFHKKNGININDISKNNEDEYNKDDKFYNKKKQYNILESSKVYSSTNNYWENRFKENEKRMEKIRKEEEFKEMGEVKKKPNISNNSKKIVKEIKNVSGGMNKLNVEKIIDKGKKNDKQITFYQKYKFPVGDYFEARQLLNQRDEELKYIPVKRLLDDDFDRKYNYYNNNIQNLNNLQNINQNHSNTNLYNPNFSNNNLNIQTQNISNQNLQNQSLNQTQNISNQNLQNQ
jgi:hypothetical protein